ncbi:DUF4391 domain-containing protein [uncultured Fibrobacter sp.]|uniref:DUF4391 domain-containing protein n=1 Tax=uncultured Fibrobacter sp. TaxID=261512 RepID=UPI0025E118EA|nr:DUF4391 domain-containing protein [uncultured Fibrobacter sp.]
MINLPSSTFVGKVVPKEKFYSKCAVNTATKNLFVKYVEQIVWQNKLTAQTMAAEKGLLVNEIDVFEVKMKSFDCPRKLFEFIDQNLHHHNIFVLTYDDKAKLFVNFKEKEKDETFLESFETPWMPADEPAFNLSGSNMDEIYESIVCSAASDYVIASEVKQSKTSLKDYIIQNKQNAKIQAQIEKLEKKLANEKQFNRQVEIRAEIRKLEKEMKT